MTADNFRDAFPEWTEDLVADSSITYWMGIADNFVNAARWGNLTDFGKQLFMAHNIALELYNKKLAKGSIPGINKGVINSESVDKASVGYDTNSASVKDAGHWNLTTYGTRFYQLMLLIGAGPLQIGTCGGPSLSAWPGVIL